MLKYLLQRVVQAGFINDSGYTPRSYAARSGAVGTLRILLSHPDINVNATNEKAISPIFNVAASENIEMMQVLLEHPDVHVDAKTSGGGSTPLCYAALFGNIPTAKLLHQAGADINARDNSDTTVLQISAENGHSEFAEWLVSMGAVSNHSQPEMP